MPDTANPNATLRSPEDVTVGGQNKRMTICAIGSANSTHVATRVRCFAEMGHRVFLVTETPSAAGIEGVVEVVPSPNRRLGLLLAICRRIGVPGLDDLWRTFALIRILRRCRPDIVHVHFAYSYYGWLVGVLGCRPLVVTVMGGDVLFEEQGSPTALGKWLTLELLRKADYITSKSNYLTEELDRLGGFGAKTERIVWGISASRFHRLDAAALRATLGLSPQRRVILSPKILRPLYRVHLVVEAMAIVRRDFPEAVLLVTEYSPEPYYRAQIARLIEQLELSDHVRFCGHVDHDSMPLYYSLAEFCVAVPSSDGLPQTLLESIACETPNILSRLPRYEEIVRHEESAYFVEPTPQDIAAGICRLLDDATLCAKIASQALEIVRREANLDVQARRVERGYHRLAASIRPQIFSLSGMWGTWHSYRRFRTEAAIAAARERARVGRTQSVLMICAHEPNLDPRIRWEAEFAARRFDVTVLGFNRDDEALPAAEMVSGYRLIRLPRYSVSGFHYFWRLKSIMPVWVRIPMGLMALLVLPLLVAAEIAGRLVRAAMRAKYRAQGVPRLGMATLLGKIRGRFLGRLDYIAAVLSTQFATATSRFWRHLRDMPVKPDVVHCNDLDTLLVGVLAKEHYGCRVVFDAHEFYPRSDPDGRRLDITFFSLLERFLIRRADAVVTVNPPLAEAMREAYGLERVYAVPNAEPWVEDRAPAPPGSQMERLAAGRVKFLFQGRFTPGRGIEELIEGWSEVDGTRAALFLRGPDNLWRQAAMRLVARLGLESSVYFLDAVGEAELVTAAAEANVGVIPYKPRIINDRLSCPNKLSQYLHAGLLVIANDLPYVKSVLSEADAGLFYSSAEPGTLAKVVHRVVAEPDLLKRSRQNALRFARERFNWQAQSETLYALYQPLDRAVQTARLAEVASLP